MISMAISSQYASDSQSEQRYSRLFLTSGSNSPVYRYHIAVLYMTACST